MCNPNKSPACSSRCRHIDCTAWRKQVCCWTLGLLYVRRNKWILSPPGLSSYLRSSLWAYRSHILTPSLFSTGSVVHYHLHWNSSEITCEPWITERQPSANANQEWLQLWKQEKGRWDMTLLILIKIPHEKTPCRSKRVMKVSLIFHSWVQTISEFLEVSHRT